MDAIGNSCRANGCRAFNTQPNDEWQWQEWPDPTSPIASCDNKAYWEVGSLARCCHRLFICIDVVIDSTFKAEQEECAFISCPVASISNLNRKRFVCLCVWETKKLNPKFFSRITVIRRCQCSKIYNQFFFALKLHKKTMNSTVTAHLHIHPYSV